MAELSHTLRACGDELSSILRFVLLVIDGSVSWRRGTVENAVRRFEIRDWRGIFIPGALTIRCELMRADAEFWISFELIVENLGSVSEERIGGSLVEGVC